MNKVFLIILLSAILVPRVSKAQAWGPGINTDPDAPATSPPCFTGIGPQAPGGAAPCGFPSNGSAAVGAGAGQTPQQACATEIQSTYSTCTSPQGVGAQSAAAIQAAANTAAMQQEMSAANQTNGGVTVVNVTNTGQQTNPGANAACNATKLMGDANMISSVVATSFCMHAVSACRAACDTDSGQNMGAQCNQALHVFEAQVIPQALNGAIVMMGGAACNNALTNANPPALAAPPGMPATDEPGNIGYQGNPAASPDPADFDQGGGGSGGSSLPTGGYPAVAGDKNNPGAGGSSQKSYDLGLSNGGGGGVPFANNGSGTMPGKSDPSMDLLASLFGKDKDVGANRQPASMNEITGATDLTNFQKVTRMMNKKRTTLKSGDGV